MKLESIVKTARLNAIINYDKEKGYTNTDEGYEMIVFLYKTLRTRKVNDWGREEDEDEYLGIDEKGWIVYSHIIEHLAGPIKIKEPHINRVTDEYVVNYLKSDECTEKEFLSFMNKAYSLYIKGGT